MTLAPIVIAPCIYVLELEDGYYYVGITYSLNLRMAQHWTGVGAKWTRLHKPIAVREVIYPATEEDEDTKTIQLMGRYGYDKVRGGKWSNPAAIYRP